MLKTNKINFLFFVWFFCFAANAQVNLVPNTSFESYTACPSTLDQLYLATGWSSYRGSPDYYNACASSTDLAVPHNGIGYQAASTGSAYAGFIAYDIGGLVREIIGCQLTQTMIVGQIYYVSIKVSLAEFQPPPPQNVPCNKIGVKFSKISYQGSDSPFPGTNPTPINNLSHVYSNTIISDTMNWTKIQGSFIADSSYQYIMIGNFFDDTQTDTIKKPNGVISYFFVDDICVSTSSTTCGVITDIGKYQQGNSFSIYPNPAKDLITINNSTNEEFDISIFNCSGKMMVSKKAKDLINIDTSEFSEGIYFLRLQSKNLLETKKLIINH